MISVIINVYNGEKFINKCLDSIINQTYKNLEILIINDGSTDGTLNIIKKYKDKRIRVINNKKNIGLSLSRNVGIDNAKGEYLYFVDADDFIEIDTIEYLYNLIKKYNVDISTCKCLDIYDYDYKLNQTEEKIQLLAASDYLKKVLISQNREVSIWNKLIKKELFNNIKFENRIINDIAFTHKIILKSKNIIYSNQIKYFYFNNSEGISHMKENDLDRAIDRYNSCIERYEYIKNIYPDLIENDISLIQNIARLYRNNNVNVKKYLDDKSAVKLYKKLFSFKKLFKCDMNIKSKIKLCIFRFSPKLHNIIVKKYLNKKFGD